MKKAKQETWSGHPLRNRVALWVFVGHLGSCHLSSKLYWITFESTLRQIWFVVETYGILNTWYGCWVSEPPFLGLTY